MPLFTFLFWFFQDSAGLGFNHQKMCVCMYVYAAYRYSELMSREAILKGDQKHVSSRMSDSRIPSNVDAVSQADSVTEPLNMNMEEHIEIVEPLKLPYCSYTVDMHGIGLRPIKLPFLIKMLEVRYIFYMAHNDCGKLFAN